MEFQELKSNNRVQMECEHENPIYRNVKGIVVEVGERSVILATDFGELLEVYEDRILSITQITFPKVVSDSLMKIKGYYTEVYELEYKLKKLREQEAQQKEELYDANFLSKFNVRGAKNRLDNSIDPKLLSFTKDNVSHRITFKSNPNEQIELHILIANQIDYPNLDVHDTEKIIRVHAPNAKELLDKCFPFATKALELEKSVVHEEESLYSVRTSYQMNIDVSQDTFLNMRERLVKGLLKLRQ